jgi:hypothetical protein
MEVDILLEKSRDDDPNDQLPSNAPDSEAEASKAVKPEMLPF